MVQVEKIQAGLTRYLDTEVLPRLPTVKALALGTAAALYIRQLPEMCSRIPASLKLVSPEGQVDLDAIRDALADRISGEVPVDLPLIGRLTFDGAEIDKICRYIREA